MKKTVSALFLLALAVPAFAGERNVEEDPSGEIALLTWRDPVPWQAGLEYTLLIRPVEWNNVPLDLEGDIVEAMVGVSPWPWLLLYGQAGVTQARLDEVMTADTRRGASGALGAKLNLWQIYQGAQRTSWRLTVQLGGQYAYRSGGDDGAGELAWGEALFVLPVDYHLTFARTFRNTYMSEFQSLHVYAGPAYSMLDGTWTRGDTEEEFSEADAVGAVLGGEFWLLPNLAFGVRADWFDDVSTQFSVRYRF